MQIPYRKPGKFTNQIPDPLMTADKYTELKNKLDHLKQIRPSAAAEVARLAELGDFSENAEYQLAKGRLRGINENILRLESQINDARIIDSNEQSDTVQLGHRIVVEVDGKQKIFQILGSAETNPQKGVISHHSPLGAALLGHAVGDTVSVRLASKVAQYTILEIK